MEIAESDKPLFDALPKLVQRTQELLKAAGLTCKISVNDDAWSDPSIELDTTGIGVCISWDSDKVTYGAFTTVYNPGVMYYPDGSGEPPSEDYSELGKASTNPNGPLTEAIKALIEFRLNDLFEHEADEEEAKYWAEMERVDFNP